MRSTVAALIISFNIVGSLCTISLVGKPRQPVMGGVAAATVLIQALISLGVYWLWASS